MNHNEEVIIGNLIQCEYGATIVKEIEFQKNRKDDLICPWHHQIDNNMVKSKQMTSCKKKRKKSAQKDNKKKKIAIPSNSNLYYQRCKLICNRKTKESPEFTANNISATSYRNKATKNTGVLSYSNPSWRFITDTNYSYIERDHPKDILKYFNFVSRSKSSNITKTKSQLLDPAVFLDEKIASAYKVSKTYQPDKSRITVINNIRELNETCSGLTKRLVSSTVLQNIDNQSEGEEEKVVRESAKKYTKKPKTFKNNQDKHSEFKLHEKEKLPIIKHIKEVKDGLINNKKDLYLPSLSLPKIQARLSTLKGPNKVYNSSIMRQREVTKQLIEGHSLSSSSYLPSLTFGHYKEKYYVPVRVESKEKNLPVKLPPIDAPNLPENLAQNFSHSITKINLV